MSWEMIGEVTPTQTGVMVCTELRWASGPTR